MSQQLHLYLLVDHTPVRHFVVGLAAVEGGLSKWFVCNFSQTCDKRTTNFTHPDHVLLYIAPSLEEDLHLVVCIFFLHTQLPEPLDDEGVEVRREDEQLLAVLNERSVLVCPKECNCLKLSASL